MQELQPDYICEKHNGRIINIIQIGTEVTWQCQTCINEQQRSVSQFLQDYRKLAEDEKTRLTSSQKEREDRYKVLKKIMTNIKDEVCQTIDVIILKIDQQMKKTQKQIHDKIENINNQDKQVIGENYARLSQDINKNYQKQNSIEDIKFKNKIYQMLLEALQKTEQWSNQFNEQWNEIKIKQNIQHEDNDNDDDDFDIEEYASTTTQRNWYKTRNLSARPGTSEGRNFQISTQPNLYKIQQKVPSEFKQARPKQ